MLTACGFHCEAARMGPALAVGVLHSATWPDFGNHSSGLHIPQRWTGTDTWSPQIHCSAPLDTTGSNIWHESV